MREVMIVAKRKTKGDLVSMVRDALKGNVCDVAVRTVTQVNYDDPGEIVYVGLEEVSLLAKKLAGEAVSKYAPARAVVKIVKREIARNALATCRGDELEASRRLGVTVAKLRKYLNTLERQ